MIEMKTIRRRDQVSRAYYKPRLRIAAHTIDSIFLYVQEEDPKEWSADVRKLDSCER